MTAADRRAVRLLASVLVALGTTLAVAAAFEPIAGSLLFPMSAVAGIVALAALAPERPRRSRAGACTREGHRQMTCTK